MSSGLKPDMAPGCGYTTPNTGPENRKSRTFSRAGAPRAVTRSSRRNGPGRRCSRCALVPRKHLGRLPSGRRERGLPGGAPCPGPCAGLGLLFKMIGEFLKNKKQINSNNNNNQTNKRERKGEKKELKEIFLNLDRFP